MNTTLKSIEEELKKVFVSLGSEKWVKVSFILSKLDLFFIEIEQRESAYPVESMLKLYVYKRVKGISRYPVLVKEIGNDCELLGLSSIPTKQNLNHFLRTKVNKQTLEILDLISEKILTIATQNRIILDLGLVKKDIKDFKDKKREQRKVAKESTRILKKLIYPQIQLEIGKNSRFTTSDLLDILVHIAQTHDFANNGCASFKDLYETADAPDGDTLLYHIKKFKSRNELKKVFDKITDIMFSFAKKNYIMLNKRKLDIAYDIHKIPYYGNKNDEYVKGSKPERGTSYFYQFLTCDIVTAGKRFTLDIIPVHPFDSVEELLQESLKKVKTKIRINRAFLDRGFSNSKCIKVLRNENVDYLMPITKSPTIKQWYDKSEECKARLIKGFKVGDELTNLYLVDDAQGIKRCFVTNLNVPVLLSHHMFKIYGKRWGIETGYRLKAQDYRIRTTSKNYTLRLFYFLFSAMLYNLWVLTNILVGVNLYGEVPIKPIITAKRFSIILYKIKEDYIESGG